MDRINKRILNLLQNDARLTYVEIAEKLKRSKSTVRERIKKLERDGVIKSYRAVLDKHKMGYQCSAVVMCNADGDDPETLAKKILSNIDTSSIFIISSERHFMFEVCAYTNEELEEILLQNKKNLGLKDIIIHVILKEIDSKDWRG